MKKRYGVMFFVFMVFWLWGGNGAFAQGVLIPEIASSPNPVGSGARALGMGGAFIGVADDATAASWNPGGLIKLNWFEVSGVVNWYHRVEDNAFANNPEANGAQSVSEEDINYFSIAYPFELLNRKMIVSLNYQHLYDFNREWDFQMRPKWIDFESNTSFESDFNMDIKQDGSLSALGLAYCVQVIPAKLSLGVTFNFWDDELFNNEWDKHVRVLGTQTVKMQEPPFIELYEIEVDYYRHENYKFSGFNANIGMLWRPNNQLSIGMVLKTPFTADVEHKTFENTSSEPNSVFDEEWDMPMSYGIGFAYRFSDSLTLSADVYRTEWNDFVMKRTDGTEESIITGKNTDESDIDPTHQVRIGAEYLFINPESKFVIPIRGGLFYDPTPAQGSPDDIYGVSLGTGLVYGRYVFDIACEYRYGNDVGTALIENYDYSHDLNEFRVYSSLIIHFEN